MRPWKSLRPGMALHDAGARVRFKEHPGRLLVVVAAILLCMPGIAAVMAWAPNRTGLSDDVVPGEEQLPARLVGTKTRFDAGSPAAEMRVRARCDHCGVVVSSREVDRIGTEDGARAAAGVKRAGKSELDEKPIKYHEVTVVMRDGAKRVFMHADRVSWRPGERLILIAGTGHASD